MKQLDIFHEYVEYIGKCQLRGESFIISNIHQNEQKNIHIHDMHKYIYIYKYISIQKYTLNKKKIYIYIL